tara:strand:- start:489 stop:1097 length:609 start_codon:yes stop_codon:yes gene_type:complete
MSFFGGVPVGTIITYAGELDEQHHVSFDGQVGVPNPDIGTISGLYLPDNATPIKNFINNLNIFNNHKCVWIRCDGCVLPAVPLLNDLKVLMGNAWGNSPSSNEIKIPDLRGLFLRGLNNSRSDNFKDPDETRNLGDLQEDKFKNHQHNIFTGTGNNNSMHIARISNGSNPSYDQEKTEMSSDGDNDETRPKNAAVNYLIRIM